MTTFLFSAEVRIPPGWDISLEDNNGVHSFTLTRYPPIPINILEEWLFKNKIAFINMPLIQIIIAWENYCSKALMTESVDVTDLKSVGLTPSRFESG